MKQTAFEAKKISRTSSIQLNASPMTVFPLFGPIEEKKWAYGWNPRIIYPASNRVGQNMVFKTRIKGQGRKTEPIWVVSKYLPENAFIEYTVFTSERIWWITIKCQEETSDQITRAIITYAFISLTEKGNAENLNHLARIFAHDLKDWEESINDYLKSGKTLIHHHE